MFNILKGDELEVICMFTVGKKLHAERKLTLEGVNLEAFFF